MEQKDTNKILETLDEIESDAVCEYKSAKTTYSEGVLDTTHRIKQLIKEIAKQPSDKEIQMAEFRRDNRIWLLYSAMIALDVRRYMRQNNVSEKHVAEQLNISQDDMRELLSGRADLKMSTLCKIAKIIPNESTNLKEFFAIWQDDRLH